MVDIADILAKLTSDFNEIDNLSGEEQKAIISAGMNKFNALDYDFAEDLVNRMHYLTLLQMTAATYSPELAAVYGNLIAIYKEVVNVLHKAHFELDNIVQLEHKQIDEENSEQFFSA